MATTQRPVAPVDHPVDGSASPGRPPRRLPALVGLVPFAVYTAVFLAIPVAAIVVGAFQDPETGAPTLRNLDIATTGVYRDGFITTVELSIITAILPGILGLAIAYAVHTGPSTALRRGVAAASGVFAYFGGVPLAFLFIATLGSSGLAVQWLKALGFDPYDHGFSLYGLAGLVVIYLYFQIPLMVLVITPALDGLRPGWREAADSLGASAWQYWRLVGGPVLLPSFLGSVLLLFGGAFSSFATADALTSGTVPITPIQIGSFLNGNVLAGQENVGKALGLGMIVIIAVLMVGYSLLQRRASRWLSR